MADKKKVYSITINGLKESVDLAKSLNDQLATIESTLKKIGNTKIKVEGELDVNKKAEKKIVSGTNTADSTTVDKEALVQKEKELAIQKQITAEIKATGQAQASLTSEYKDALTEQMKQQEVVKEVKQGIKDMFSGAKNDAGEYTNTLAGLRAELRDLAKQQKSVDLGSEEYNKLDDRILSLTTNLNALEQAHGDFRRQVGKYPTAEIEAFRAKFEELYGNMQQLVQESNNLQRQLQSATPGTAEYEKLSSQLKNVQTRLKEAKQNVDSFNNSLKATPKNFEIQVGSTVRNFNSVKDAVKTLTKELQVMTYEGKENTEEFEVTIQALGKLKTAISNTSGEISSYVGNAKGLSDTIEIMKGVTGLASIGQGIMGLFGGINSDLDESISKFTNLTLIMQGIETQYKAIQDGTSIWGTTLSKVWNWLDKIGNIKLLLFTGPTLDQTAEKFGKLAKDAKNYAIVLKSMSQWESGNVEEGINRISQEMTDLTNNFAGFPKSFKENFVNIINSLDNYRIAIDTRPAEQKLQYFDDLIKITQNSIKNLTNQKVSLDPDIDVYKIAELEEHLTTLKKQLYDLQKSKVAIETGDTEQIFQDLEQQISSIDEEIEAMNKQGIDTEKFKKLWTELKTVSMNTKIANENIGKTPALLRNMANNSRNTAVGMQVAATAVSGLAKAIKGLLKVTVILAVVQGAFEALTWIVEKLADAFKALKGPGVMDLDDRLDMISESSDRAKESLGKYIDSVERAAKTGLITELEAEVLALKAVEKYAMDAAKQLKDYLNTQEEIKAGALSNNLNNSSILGDNSDIKNIDEFKAHYEVLTKAVEDGTDKIAAGWKSGNGWLLTAGDAVEQLGDDTKAILGDMQNEINKINFNNPEQAVKDFKRITDNELYKSAIANMHKLFPEEEWAKTLDRMYTIFSQRVADMEGRAGDLKIAMIQANKELAKQTELSNINAIADPNKRQAALDNYNKKQRQEEIKNSLADEKHKQEALTALDKEYKQKAIDRQKSYAKTSHKSATSSAKKTGDDLEKIMKQIRDNQTTIMKDGLDKEIKLLENARDDELKAAKKAGKKQAELIQSIQDKYNFLIQKKREEWFKKHRKTIEAFNKEILKITQDAANELANVQEQSQLNKINREIDENEVTHTSKKRDITYDTTINETETFESNKRLLQAQKKYHQDSLKEEKEYLSQKSDLRIAESQQNMQNLLNEEERNYKAQIDANKEAQKAKWEEVYEWNKQGIISDEEAMQMQQQVAVEYQIASLDLEEAHQAKIAEIRKNAATEQKIIQEETIQEQQDAQNEANNKRLSSIQEMYNEIAEISESEQRKNTNRTTGLFNLGKERKRLQDVKQSYEDTIKEIEQMYEDLKTQFENGEISFEMFEEGKKQLDSLKKDAVKSAEDTQDSLSDLFQTWGKSMANWTQQIGSQMQSLYSQFNEIMNLKYDMEEEALDREQEQLDRESEMVEKAYDKQAEIVQRYKDRINESEDELKTARGERRLALIDGLAKQREGYLAETEALAKQQQEKEKIAKKEEALKKKQDALEKKRKQQQKQQSLINSIINTALGVTQALGAFPPPASWILAAAVGAMGAAQTAMIASQKYAKGGVIDGPSHSQGGIKIPTKKGISEVEGNEFITNKKTTSHNTEFLYYINSIKRKITKEDMDKFFDGKGKVSIPASHGMKFATGGVIPEMTDFNIKNQIQPQQQEPERTYLVQVTDIFNKLEEFEKVRVLAGLYDGK